MFSIFYVISNLEGLRIFKHAVLVLFRNPFKVMVIALIPWLAVQMAGVFLLALLLDIIGLAEYENSYVFDLGILAINVFVTLWIVVAWHRFILLDELPRKFSPKWHSKTAAKYALNTLLVTISGLPVLFAVSWYFSTSSVFLDMYQIALTPLAWLLVLFNLVLLIRLGLTLPSVAIEQHLGLRGAWRASSGKTFALVQIVILMIICRLLFAIPGEMYPNNNYVILLELVLAGIPALIGVSVLTTMYGTWVEGREL